MLHAQVLTMSDTCPCSLPGACLCPLFHVQILSMSVACPCLLPCACLSSSSLCPLGSCPRGCVSHMSLAGGGQPF
eukprot:6393606-Amphidinium_carterae.1